MLQMNIHRNSPIRPKTLGFIIPPVLPALEDVMNVACNHPDTQSSVPTNAGRLNLPGKHS